MYKDKDKQREANRKASKRYRRIQGMTVAIEDVIPKTIIPKILKRKTLAEITNTERAIEKACCSEGVTGGNDALPKQGVTDSNYPSTDEPKESFVSLKRGKDIKVFADLPMALQRSINIMSQRDGKIDKTIKANRTAIAINYQHIFPDRFHSVGVI